MKKSLLILSFAICFNTFGQLDYTFAKSTSTYVALTSPTVITKAWTQDFITKLPFQFTYFKKPFDSLAITPNSIGFTSKKADFIAMGQEDYYFDGKLYPVGAEISYLITGAAPNRIVKAQFKNLRAVTTDTSEEYRVNNQIWIYETSNKIEFHFGQNINTDVNITTFYFGFRDSDGSPYLAISGTAASPTFIQVANAFTFKGISTHPTDGTVYTFTPYAPATIISKIAKPYTFSNSSESFSVLTSQNSKLLICDLSGKQISGAELNAGSTFEYNYSGLSKGMYLVTIHSNNQLYTEKIIVQ